MAGRFDNHTNAIGYTGLGVSGQIVTSDGNATPVVSPQLAVPITPFAFTTPANAVTFTFRTTGACRYGENSTLDGTATHGYKKGSSSSDITIPCNSMPMIYVRAEAGTIDVDFFYETLVLS